MKHSPLRSPLSRVRGLGSAKDGTGHWWWERLTSVIIAPLSLWFVYSLLTLIGKDRYEVAEWFMSPLASVGALILLTATFYHSKLGVQVIIEDYVHATCTKYTLLIVNLLVHIALTIISWLAVLKLHTMGI